MAGRQIIGGIVSGSPRWRRIFEVVVRFLVRVLLQVRVSGLENVPLHGPVVVIINHIAFLDPVIAMAVIHRPLIPLAKVETLDLPFWGWMTREAGSIPVHRGEVDTTAIKQSLRVLKNNGFVLLAPEGTRSPTYQLQAGKHGAGLLALRGGAQVLPVGITGSHRVKNHWLRFKRPPIDVSIGPTFQVTIPQGGKRPNRDQLEQLTKQVMYRLAAQLPPPYRGVYTKMPVLEDCNEA